MAKKFYWLKLKEDFFDDLTIKMIEEMENGIYYTNFLMKLYLKSLKTEGKLLFRDTIPYDEKMLSVLTGVNIDTVRTALKIFLEFGMVERWDDGTLYISEVQTMIGNETESARRVRKHREEKTKALQCNTFVTKSNTEIELEKELDIDINTNTPIGSCVSVDPKKEQREKEFEAFWETYQRKGSKKRSKVIFMKLPQKSIDEIRANLPAYLFKTKGDLTYRKNAETYLNPKNEAWNDLVFIQVPENKPVSTIDEDLGI